MDGPASEPAYEVLGTLIDIESGELRDLFDREWNALAQSAFHGTPTDSDLRRRMLAQPPEHVFEIEKVEPDSMGIISTAGALFVLKFLATKLADAALAATARALVDEIISRIRNRRGSNFLRKVRPARSKTRPQA
jgi:hypothetical protein